MQIPRRDKLILKERERVYQAAKQKHPQRWSGDTRNWDPVKEVWLNPPKEHQAEQEQETKAA